MLYFELSKVFTSFILFFFLSFLCQYSLVVQMGVLSVVFVQFIGHEKGNFYMIQFF